MSSIPNPRIPEPIVLYGAARRNSTGIDLNDALQAQPLLEAFRSLRSSVWQALGELEDETARFNLDKRLATLQALGLLAGNGSNG